MSTNTHHRFTIITLSAILAAILTACGGNDYDPHEDPTACMSFDGKPVECIKGTEASHG